MKYLVSEVLIAVFDLRLGFHAATSSTTKMRFKAFMYEAIVSLSILSPSFFQIFYSQIDENTHDLADFHSCGLYVIHHCHRIL